jgi:hypothetical protein
MGLFLCSTNGNADSIPDSTMITWSSELPGERVGWDGQSDWQG